MITLSIIKADTGGFVGHSAVHPRLMAEARREIERAKSSGLLIDGHVESCGDGISLIMTHTYGQEAGLIHSFAWDTLHAGFAFEVYDLHEDRRIVFDCPADLYDMLMYIGAPARYVIHNIRSKTLGMTAAATSTQRLSLIAGRYVGKDDPVLIVRCQSGLPAVGEALEPFAFAYSVAGCMRGSHHAPLMPVATGQAHPSRFDGPPRVVALGFQIKDGRLIGPRDMFDDPAFDGARRQAGEVMDYLRRHGPFEPHRLPLEDLEYTTMTSLTKRLAHRWTPITTEVATPVGSGTE
ncbi:fructose 1,6-bisphosphatase [Microbispora siamensis]